MFGCPVPECSQRPFFEWPEKAELSGKVRAFPWSRQSDLPHGRSGKCRIGELWSASGNRTGSCGRALLRLGLSFRRTFLFETRFSPADTVAEDLGLAARHEIPPAITQFVQVVSRSVLLRLEGLG